MAKFALNKTTRSMSAIVCLLVYDIVMYREKMNLCGIHELHECGPLKYLDKNIILSQDKHL